MNTPNGPSESKSSQVSEDPTTVFRLVGGQAGNGDGRRIEKAIQVGHRNCGITSEANNSRLSSSPMS